MNETRILDGLFEALGEVRTQLGTSNVLGRVLKELLAEHFRASAFGRESSGAVWLGPFGNVDLPYRRMGNIDSVDLFGLDELLLFAFYWANRKLYRRTLDIGANLGLHSIMMARAGFEVAAFEPDPVHFDLLLANLARNAVKNVSPERVAISEKDGELEFVRVLNNTTGSHLAGAKNNPYGPLDNFTVSVRAIAPLAANADFAKVDAEGHEVTILKSIPAKTWERFDVMVEIGTADNAAAVYEHFQKINVNLFPQKISWEKAIRFEDLPTSHREGSLFVTRRNAMPWGS